MQKGRHGDLVISTAVSQQEGPGFDQQVDQGHLVKFAWFRSARVGFLQHSKDKRIRLLYIGRRYECECE